MTRIRFERDVIRACLSLAALAASLAGTPVQAVEMQVPVTFSGGHEIARGDYGRPVVLIAAGLGVKPDVFREAFSGVTPARGGGPSREEARRNKAALMKVLAPYGVSNDRLDEVSNYYRFRRDRGELWKTRPAQAHALVVDGRVRKIIVTDPGSGYCTPPRASVQGFDHIPLQVTLHLDRELEKNGSIGSIEIESRSNSR